MQMDQDVAQLEKRHLMVCNYQWDLVGIENNPMTILSKMIKFQGVKSFRVGIKNHGTLSTLFLMTSSLNKIGLKVEAVTCSYVGYESNEGILVKDEFETGSLQLFTSSILPMATGNHSFIFKIYLSGIIEDYRTEEMDFLLRSQLRSSLLNRVGTDFEIIADGMRFPVHKFVLAARSPVFAAKFQDDNHAGGTTEDIDFVDSTTVEQFLKFIYTGELEGPVKSQHLMQLALFYEIKTLQDICEAASHDIDVDQMASFGMKLNPTAAQEFAIAIRPDVDQEIHHVSTSVIFDCAWILQNVTIKDAPYIFSSETFVYQLEKLFTAQVQIKLFSDRQPDLKLVISSCDQVRYKIDEVDAGDPINGFVKLHESSTGDEKKLKVFAADLIQFINPVTFHVKMSSTVTNFGLTLADSTWTKQLWAAALDGLLTDVNFLIAGKSISAHRSLLSARSPVFSDMFASWKEEARTGQVRIDDVDPDSFLHFLQFIYTGTLVHTADKAKIFIVADKYQVETLIDLCRPSTQSVDIDATTEAFPSC